MSSDVIHDLSTGSAPLPGVPTLEDFRTVRGAERDALFDEVERVARRLDALRSAMITEVQTSESFLDDAHHSVVSWVAAVANCTRDTAKVRVRTARMLAALPVVAAANSAGDVGADQLRVLANLHANPRAREHMGPQQDDFVFWARWFAAGDFTDACKRWRAAADPDGSMADRDACRENRHATFSELGAGFRFTAEGDALTGDILRRALEERMQIEWENDIAARKAEWGDDAEQHPLPRTQRQRAYDAWVHLTMNGPNERHRREPLVNIVCTPEVLVAAIRDFVGGPDPDVVTRDGHEDDEARAASLRSYLCETVTGVQVDPRDLAIAALTGEVRRVIKDSAGRVIDLGRRSRLFRGGSREAVLLTDCRCSRPGCCDQHVGLQIDHRSPWGALGVTSSINGAALCGRQNRAKHEHGLRITRDETGWRWWRADGTEIAPRQPPAK